MICKLLPGASFGGAIEYAMGKEGAEVLDSKDVRSYDRKLAIKDFELISKQNERVKLPVMHIAVSFHQNDKGKITDAKMNEIAKEVIDKMGYSNCQHLIIKHNDTKHPHVHIITSRIDLDGKTVSDKYSRLRLNNIRIEIELKNPQLTSAAGKNIKDSNPAKLKGRDSIKYKIYNAINIEIQKSSDINQLIKNLEKNHGIKTELKYRRGSIAIVEGIKFHKDNTWITGSKVDKNCSYLNLLKRLKESKVEVSKINPKVNHKVNLTMNIAGELGKALVKNKEPDMPGIVKRKGWNSDNDMER